VVGKRSFKALAINRAISEQLEARTGAAIHVRAPKQILSILVSGDRAYSGLSLAWQNLSDWPGGEHRFARRKEQISRAEFKLLEALSKFNLDLPPHGRALDLGAAPGGWTRVLREKRQVVTAIDPGQLHPQLAADKNVRHLPITAEAYLAQGPDQYDLIVNDMRLDARDSARILNDYARLLYRHGLALMTLKLPGKRAAQTIRQALEILGNKYEITHSRQLFHNRQEITLLLRPRKQPD
jgi:23S rRNA (cytidine2498-2'-O)-methyltransferase